MDTTLNAARMATRLREVATVLETGDWEAVFYAHDALRIIAAEFGSFCDAAKEIGTAPNFLAVSEWVRDKTFS